MDERIEWQLSWLEASAATVIAEARTLVSQVEGGEELLEDLLQTAAALHMQLEALKGKLTFKPAEVKEEVKEEFPLPSGAVVMTEEELAGLATTIPEGAGERITAHIEPAQAEPKREEKHEASEYRP